MQLWTIAIKSMKRRWGKTALVVFALSVGITSFVAVVISTIAFSASTSRELSAYGANILVYPASADLMISYGGMNVTGMGVSQFKALKVEDVRTIKALPEAKHLSAISAKAVRAVDAERNKLLVIGVDFSSELAIKRWWHITGMVPKEANQVLFGKEASKKLGRKAGDTIMLSKKRFQVSGVLDETGSQDDGVVFARLDSVWRSFGRNREIDLVEMRADDIGEIDRVDSAISKALPMASVSSVKQAIQYKQGTMTSILRFGLGTAILILFAAGFVVFSTMMGSVHERASEIGIFRAIGFRRKDVMRIVQVEALVISIFGGLLGSSFGLLFVLAVGEDARDIWMYYGLSALAGISLSVVVGQFSSLLPAKKAAALDPSEAMKAF